MSNTPKKFKGFSKLPEAVQQKMNPEAAVKYMEGGAVKKPDVSMYMEGGSVKGGTEAGHSRGGGAALSGTKFSGVK